MTSIIGKLCELTALIKKNPDKELYVKRANALCSIGYFDRAISDYKSALELDPSFYSAYFYLGITYASINNFEKALPELYRSRDLAPYPNNAAVLDAIGCVFEKMGESKKAVSTYREALKINENAITLNNLSCSLISLLNFEEAKSAIKRALELDSNNNAYYNTLGMLLIYEGSFGEAITNLKKSIELKNDYANVYLNLGKAQILSKDFDEALKSLNHVSELNPNYFASYAILGLMYHFKGNFDSAKENYKKSLELFNGIKYKWADEYKIAFRAERGLKKLGAIKDTPIEEMIYSKAWHTKEELNVFFKFEI